MFLRVIYPCVFDLYHFNLIIFTDIYVDARMCVFCVESCQLSVEKRMAESEQRCLSLALTPTPSAGSALCSHTLRYRNAALVKVHLNESVLSLSATSSVLFNYLAFNGSF